MSGHRSLLLMTTCLVLWATTLETSAYSRLDQFRGCSQTTAEEIVLDSEGSMLFDRKDDMWSRRNPTKKLCDRPKDIVFFKDFAFLMTKNKTDYPFCFKVSPYPTTSSCYSASYNASCLKRWDDGMVRESVLPFFEQLSGAHKDLATASSVEKNLTYLDPNLNSIRVDYGCSTKVRVMDICQNLTVPKLDKVMLQFDESKLPPNRSSCLCYLHSFNNVTTQMDVQAYDVRLLHTVRLLMDSDSVANCNRQLGDHSLYWWQDGNICQAINQMTISLINMDHGAFPKRVLLRVNGTNMTVTCGQKVDDYKFIKYHRAADAESLGTVYILCIIAGVLAVVILVLCVVRFMWLKRHPNSSEWSSSSLDDYDDDEDDRPQRKVRDKDELSMEEFVYPHPSKQAVPLSDDGAHRALLSSKAAEPEEYETPRRSNNNVVKTTKAPEPPVTATVEARPYSTAKPLASPVQPEEEDNYNHFHERPDVVPTGSIYDTTTGMYSSFQREPQPVHTGNHYA